eukprot:1158463-Pelagomonas_calceolata.AAC.3
MSCNHAPTMHPNDNYLTQQRTNHAGANAPKKHWASLARSSKSINTNASLEISQCLRVLCISYSPLASPSPPSFHLHVQCVPVQYGAKGSPAGARPNYSLRGLPRGP